MKKLILFTLLSLFTITNYAQEATAITYGYTGLFRKDPIKSQLFKLEDVMKHQKALRLSKQQKDNIVKAHQEAQMEFAKWQWDLQAVTEEMSDLASQSKIDETKAMSTLETMLDMERNIKRTQLRLMIKIKNQLTQAQQEKLRELIDQNRFRLNDLDSNTPSIFPEGRLKKNDK